MIAQYAKALAEVTKAAQPLGFQLVSDGEQLARLMRTDGWELRVQADPAAEAGFRLELCKSDGGRWTYLPLPRLMTAFEPRIGKAWAQPTLDNQLWFLTAFGGEICKAAETAEGRARLTDAA